MNTQALNTWFQVGATLAVLLSIGLLAYELEQQRKLAHAQFIVDTLALRMQGDIVVLGEDMGSVLAEACFSPGTLDETETTKLAKYFELRLAGITAIKEAEAIGGAETATWRRRLRRELITIWQYEAGRTWWLDQREQGWATALLEVATQAEADGLLASPRRCNDGALFERFADPASRESG